MYFSCLLGHFFTFLDFHFKIGGVTNHENLCWARWSQATFDALVMRYEAPIGTNRWDSPLLLSLEAIPLNLEALEAALFDRKPPPPNQSTQCQPLSSTNFLHELDKTTSSINSAILEAQKLGLGASDLKVPGKVLR